MVRSPRCTTYLDVTMDHTLLVEIEQPLEHLQDVERDERLGKRPKLLGNRVQGPVLAVPTQHTSAQASTRAGRDSLEDDVEKVGRLDESAILDDVGVWTGQWSSQERPRTVQVLEEVDFAHDGGEL